MNNDLKADKCTAIAAQLWCKPEFEKKVMDVDFAAAIAAALRDAVKGCAEIVVKHKHTSECYKDSGLVVCDRAIYREIFEKFEL